MQIMMNDEFETATIRRALAGDSKAGMAALSLCRTGLDSGKLSGALCKYLAERITDLLDGMRPDKALCIYNERGPGQPKNPFPEWKEQLGAFAAALTQRGYQPQRIAEAMCEVRATVTDKPMEPSDAHKIRKVWAPMQSLHEDDLLPLAGPYRKVLEGYPPLK